MFLELFLDTISGNKVIINGNLCLTAPVKAISNIDKTNKNKKEKYRIS